jgi:hypothetical protein
MRGGYEHVGFAGLIGPTRPFGFLALATMEVIDTKMREARLCGSHAQPLAPLFEHKWIRKGLYRVQKVCYTCLCWEPLANGLPVEPPRRLRERWGVKGEIRV